MHSFINVRCFIALVLAFEFCFAVELIPVRPSPGKRFGKRDFKLFELRNTESFIWEHPENPRGVVANFTVFAPGDHENVLSMERFKGMIKTTTCTPTKITLAFEDKEAFAYAQKVWDWVNGADNHTFTMVAGVNDCGDNEARVPYSVSAIQYDVVQFIATLSVKTGAWKDIINSYNFEFGSAASSTNSPAKRGDEGKGISLEHDFSSLGFKVEREPIIGQLECEECKTTGNIGYSFHINQNIIGIPNGAVLKIDPVGVSAIAKIKLTLESEFNTKTEIEPFEKNLPSIPLNGWSINNLFEVGPYLDIVAGIEFVAFKGSFSVTGGATVSLEDSAYLEADLLDFTKMPTATGWTPKFKALPVEMEINLASTIQFYLTPKIRIKAEGLNVIGVQTGVEIKSIAMEATLAATANPSGGVCEDPTKLFGFGASFASGMEVSWTAGKSTGDEKPVIEKTFAAKMFDWPEKLCFACSGPNGDGCGMVKDVPKSGGTWIEPSKSTSKTSPLFIGPTVAASLSAKASATSTPLFIGPTMAASPTKVELTPLFIGPTKMATSTVKPSSKA